MAMKSQPDGILAFLQTVLLCSTALAGLCADGSVQGKDCCLVVASTLRHQPKCCPEQWFSNICGAFLFYLAEFLFFSKMLIAMPIHR